MKLIVGLGNPGEKYKNTRHNMGYMMLDKLADNHKVDKQRIKFNAELKFVNINRQQVVLAKPLTYMNLSGQAVGALMNWFKVPLEDLLVAYDDMDITSGIVKLKPKGGAGGHKGMTSIIAHLRTNEFARLRIGIGRPPDDTIDWVLGKISKTEAEIMQAALEKAAAAATSWINFGINYSMNEYN